MTKARSMAQTALIAVLWVLAIGAVLLYFLTGCAVTQDRTVEASGLRIDADCDDNTLQIIMDLQDTVDEEGVEINQ